MKQETSNKIAAIFAAQLAAAQAKATPKFTNATGTENKDQKPKAEVKPVQQPKPQAAPIQPPPPVKKVEQPAAPELSQLTFADLMNDVCSPAPFTITKASEAIQQPPTKTRTSEPLVLVEYSPKSFAIFGATGEETKAVRAELLQLGGSYNPRLNYEGGKRAGWIFPNYRRQAVNAAFNSLQQQASKATA